MKNSIFILTFIIISNALFAQSITSTKLNEKVYGVVYRGNDQYLLTGDGYIKLPKRKAKTENDQWTEYYRKAYGDSTIQNPNTIIEQPSLNIPIRFFFPIGGKSWFEREEDFNTDAYLYDFIQKNENGEFEFRPGIIGIVGSRLTKPHR